MKKKNVSDFLFKKHQSSYFCATPACHQFDIS